MAKPYRIPHYKKMYPEAGEEVIAVLKTTERKMQYQEYDLKTEQTVISQEDQTITTIPSREDSLERLADQEMQFAEEVESVEENFGKNWISGCAKRPANVEVSRGEFFPPLCSLKNTAVRRSYPVA